MIDSTGDNAFTQQGKSPVAATLFGVIYFIIVFTATVLQLQRYPGYRADPYSEELQNMRAFVVGATGGVGQALVKELASRSEFDKITLILRRTIDLPKDDANYSKIEQKIIDFDEMEGKHGSDFQGFDVGFCALGTTRGKAGKDGFYKVDHDYVVNSAKLAKAGGCKHFQLVSSGGANKSSYFLYPQVKGQVEEEITNMNFDRLTIYRPNLLLVDRQESRPVETVLQCVFGALDRARFLSIEVPRLARAMVENSFQSAKTPVEVIDNRQIYFRTQPTKIPPTA